MLQIMFNLQKETSDNNNWSTHSSQRSQSITNKNINRKIRQSETI